MEDEFFTPNPELVSLCSEASTTTDLNENQLIQESTSSEEELEITREACQRNTGSLRSSSSSDTDAVEGEKVTQKLAAQRSIDRDWNGVGKLGFTPSAGVPQAAKIGMITALNHNHPAQILKGAKRKDEISFSEILDLSCIPCDEHFTNRLLLSKTPLSTRAPINNSTPYPVSTGKKVSSGHWPYHTKSEPVLLQTNISETSLWPSPDSSAISPGTFATACNETIRTQTPITPPESQSSATIGSIAQSVLGVANSPSERVSGKPCAAPPSSPVQLTDSIAGRGEEVVKLSEPRTLSSTLPGGQIITLAACGGASCGSQCSVFISKGGDEVDGMTGMWDKNKQNQGEKANHMPEGITSGGIVQELGEDQKVERLVQERQREASQGILEYPSAWERCSIQKSMEETERAHSTLDSVLEGMLESQDQPKEKITKMWTNDALKGEALRVSQKEECTVSGKQTNIATAQGEVRGASESRTSGTGASIAPTCGVSEESSNRNQIQRVNWTQPHRVIILE
ncbi:inactive serine/threonine-protein kinase TEX14-like [Heptranchias perlo]|uniref:inactive serine/threonine-protein kinase TEX14-like n=1 Tax=Heptranchias perlo TaxID=212740 RepID=UPI00355AA75D